MGGEGVEGPPFLAAPGIRVTVPQFTAHPSGHTIYEIVVELLETRQVWSTFHRFSEFKRLRQHLKDAARSEPAGSKHSKEILALLDRCTFPSGVLGSRSLASKEERRVAFARFLTKLIQIQPLPRVAAEFLGLLHDKRLSLDASGHYIVVTPLRELLLPLYPSLDNLAGENAGEDKDTASADAEPDSETSDGYVHLPAALPAVTVSAAAASTADVETDAAAVESFTDCDSSDDSDNAEEVKEERSRPGNAAQHVLGEEGVAAEPASAAGSEAGAGKVEAAGKGAAAPASGRNGEAAPADAGSVSAAAAAAAVAAAPGGSPLAEAAASATEATSSNSSSSNAVIKSAAKAPAAKREKPVEERVLLWEFIQGFMEQVVRKAVSKQQWLAGGGGGSGNNGGDGGSGGGGGGGSSLQGPGSPESAVVPAAANGRKTVALRRMGRPLPGFDEEERNVRIGELLSLNVSLPPDQVVLLLQYCDWAPNQAAALYSDLVSAGKGMLEPVLHARTAAAGAHGAAPRLRGAENGGNTCYIDSLLFAMFGTLDAFDWLLQKPLRAEDSSAMRLLQKHLRFFVSQLRRGAVVPAEHAQLLRTQLLAAGWSGGSSSQEDVSELFTFLVTLFRSPSLPLTEEIFHGGYQDVGDSRLSTERLLQLSLPPANYPTTAGGGSGNNSGNGADAGGGGSGSAGAAAAAPPVTLEHVLTHNFFDNRLVGINRRISGEKGEFAVDAWKMVSLLPYYCLQSEFVDQADASNDRHFDRIMLPMVLKRYETTPAHGSSSASPNTATSNTQRLRHASPTRADALKPPRHTHTAAGAAVRTQRDILIPYRLDFTDFVQLPEEKQAIVGSTHFVLVLRSAVCHIGGESLSKGHYVAYACERGRVAAAEAAKRAKAKEAAPLATPAAVDSSGASKKPFFSSEKDAAGVVAPPTAKAGSNAGYPAAAAAAVGGKAARAAALDEAALRRLSLEDACDVTWLRFDDLQRLGPGQGFVRRIERIGEIASIFSEELAKSSYLLFYEMIDLESLASPEGSRSRLQMSEVLSLLMESRDHKLAQELHRRELELSRQRARRQSDFCAQS